MNKICALARLLAVLLAIASAFVPVPMVAAILLILGGISAIDGNSEHNSRTYLIAIVLILGAAGAALVDVDLAAAEAEPVDFVPAFFAGAVEAAGMVRIWPALSVALAEIPLALARD